MSIPGSTWDIRLKNSPEDDPDSLGNVLARKAAGMTYNRVTDQSSNDAMSRRMDIINSIGDQSTANTQAAVQAKMRQNQANAVALGEQKYQAAQTAYQAAQNANLPRPAAPVGNTTTTTGTPSAGAGDPKGIGAKASSIASKLTSTPYKWGGTTTKGFDCSGLVQYVYGKMGIKMPRVSQQQATMGVKTSIANLKPGDLVAWGSSPATATHIAIYAGNGQIWEAAKAGTNVRTRTISAKEAGIMGISIKR